MMGFADEIYIFSQLYWCVYIYIYQDFTSAYLNDALGCSLQKEH